MSQRPFKILLGIAATLIGVIVLASILLYSAFVRTLNVSDYTSFSQIPLNSWASVLSAERAELSLLPDRLRADTASGTTPHTSLLSPLFYQITQDGVTLRDWLKRIVIDGESILVGSKFLS